MGRFKRWLKEDVGPVPQELMGVPKEPMIDLHLQRTRKIPKRFIQPRQPEAKNGQYNSENPLSESHRLTYNKKTGKYSIHHMSCPAGHDKKNQVSWEHEGSIDQAKQHIVDLETEKGGSEAWARKNTRKCACC